MLRVVETVSDENQREIKRFARSVALQNTLHRPNRTGNDRDTSQNRNAPHRRVESSLSHQLGPLFRFQSHSPYQTPSRERERARERERGSVSSCVARVSPLWARIDHLFRRRLNTLQSESRPQVHRHRDAVPRRLGGQRQRRHDRTRFRSLVGV